MKHLYPSKLILKVALGLLFIYCSLSTVNAQDNSVAIGSESVKPSAVLYLQGDGTQGMIIPIVTDLGNISTPESGMIVFNSGDNLVYYHDGSSWKPTGGSGGGTDTDDQELTINGNTLAITDGNSINIAGTDPSSSGQVFVWDGSQWTVSSATAPTNGQVLQWNGTTWEPATISGSGVAYTAGAGINIDGSNVISNTGDDDSTDDIISSVQVVGGNLVITEGTSTVQVPISDIEAALTNVDNDASDDITTATTIGGDLSGSMPNPTVAQIQGTPVSSTAPADQQVLKFNQTTGNWEPASDAGGVSYTAGNGITIDGSNSIAADAGTGANQLVQLDGSGALPAVDGSNLTGITASTTVTTDGATIVGDGSTGSPITANTGTGANQLVRLDGSGALPAVDGSNLTGISAGGTVTTDGTTITGDGTGGSPITANAGTGANQLVQLNGSSALPTVDGSNLTNVDATTLQGNAVSGTALAGGDAGLVLKWNGTQWVASADDTGSGAAPTLSNGQLMIGDGATNSAGTVSGDLSLTGSAFTIGANAINSGKIADGTITGSDIAASTIADGNIANVAPGKITAGGASPGQTLEWNGLSWVPATPVTGGASNLSGLTDANVTSPTDGQALIYNSGTTQFENRAVSGDATLSTTGALTLSNSGVSAGTYPKITVDTKGRVTNGSALVATDIPNLTLSKITDAGTIAGLSTIGSSNITDGSIQAADLNAMGASSGQILKWNGLVWAPAADDTGASTDDQILGYNPATNILDIETGNTVDLSDLQQTLGVAPSGTTRSISISGGNSINVDVADNDNDAANELQTISPSGSDIILSNGGGTVSINDADFDPLNEVNTGVAINGNNIEVTDPNGTVTGAITSVAPSPGQILKWNGLAWTPAADDVGAGGLPGLTDAQIVTNDGASNIGVAVGGDLTMNNTGAFTVAGLQGNSLNVSAPTNGQVLKFVGGNWIAAADDTGSGAVPTLTDAQVVTNDGTSNIAVSVSGDVTFSNTGVVTISPNAVTTAKILDGAITDSKIASVANAKVTGLGALALLGSVGSAQITDGSISTIDIGTGAVTNAQIADVAPSKITQGGATSGQVLKWDGSNWTPQNESGGASLPILTNGQIITNDGSSDIAVTVSGDVTFANDGTITIASNAVTTAKIANGAVTDAKIASVSNAKVTGLGALALLGSVGSAQITDGSITGSDIAATTITDGNIANVAPGKITQGGATSGQVLEWNGSAWVPATITSTDNQDLSLSGNTLSLTNDGTPVDLTGYLDNTDSQNAAAVPVTASGNLTSTNAQAALQELQTDIDGLGGDTDPANELQDLSLTTNTLSLSGSGATVDLSGYLDNTDAQNAAAVPVTASGNLTSTNTQAALQELQTDIDGLASSSVSALDDLSDATVGAATSGSVLIADGSNYTNQLVSGDIGLAANGVSSINTSAGNNIAAAINNASTTTEIDVTKLADQGGTTSILGSSSVGTVQWVTGAANQILGTNASGDLNFFATSAFFNGTGTPDRTAIWDAAGTGFSDGSILDDGSAITINPGVTLQFGSGQAVSNIINLATGVDLVAATASDAALVTEQAISQALIDNIGLSNLVDGYVPYSLTGILGESPIWTNGNNTAINTVTPEQSALFQLESLTGVDSRGFLMPRLSTLDRDQIVSPADGLMIYNTTDSYFNFYDGGSWQSMASAGVAAGNGLNINGGTGDVYLGGALDETTIIDLNGNPLSFTSSAGTGGNIDFNLLDATSEFNIWNGVANPAFNVNNSGNVGIGINATTDKLSVNGSFRIPQGVVNAFKIGTTNTIYNDGTTTFVNNDAASPVALSQGGTARLAVNSSGEVDVTSNLTTGGTITSTGGFFTGGAGLFRLDGSGDPYIIKGVDYSWPSAQGAIGSIFSNDGSGNLAWSDPASLGIATNLQGAYNGGNFIEDTSPVIDIRGSQSTSGAIAEINLGKDNGSGGFTELGGIAVPGSSDNFRVKARNNLVFNTNFSDRMTLTTAGNLGIGVLNPRNTLDVEGAAVIGSAYSGTNTAPAEGLLVEGRVGLGTPSPTSRLHISSTSNDGDLRLDDTIPFIYLNSSIGSNAGIQFMNNGVNRMETYFGGASDTFIMNHVASTGSDITIQPTGNIGLGVTSAVNKLDVEGGVAIGAGYSGTETASTNGLIVEGRLGVGTPNPIYGLHVEGTSTASMKIESTTGQTYLFMDKGALASNNFISFQTNGLDRWVVGDYATSSNEDFRIIDWSNGGTNNNALYIERGGINSIGIGTDTPVNKLDVEGGVVIGTTYSGLSTAPTDGLLVEGDMAIGNTNSFGSKLFIESALATSPFRARISGGTRLMVHGDGTVTVGTATDQAYDFYVNGAAAKNTGTAWVNASDYRLKDIHGKYEDGLDIIRKINPIWFTYNGKGETSKTNEKQVGIIAQELLEIAPYTVNTFKAKLDSTDVEDTELYNFDFNAINYAQINAIKELADKVDKLEDENKELKAQILNFKNELENSSTSNELEQLKSEMAEIKALLGLKAEK